MSNSIIIVKTGFLIMFLPTFFYFWFWLISWQNAIGHWFLTKLLKSSLLVWKVKTIPQNCGCKRTAFWRLGFSRLILLTSLVYLPRIYQNTTWQQLFVVIVVTVKTERLYSTALIKVVVKQYFVNRSILAKYRKKVDKTMSKA